MKIVSVVGARPEFIQVVQVSRALRRKHTEILVHTGQHYDLVMSQTFFDELTIPAPDYNLGVGSGSHGSQTAKILVMMEEVLVKEQPDLVIVRGDTNSTLASALAACKLQIPSAHIEAGERSYDWRMPEEINRLVTDRLAGLHLCVSQNAIAQLEKEGMFGSAFWVGDVMLDILLQMQPLAGKRSNILTALNLRPKEYALVTIHRPGNTDEPERLRKISAALNACQERVIFPAHPRTREALKKFGVQLNPNVALIDPVGYLDMLVLEENARLIATDSGGVQREAYYLEIPCLTLRDNTEWKETIASGWNRLVGVEPDQILQEWFHFQPPAEHPPIYGDGTAAQRIADILERETCRFGAPSGMDQSGGLSGFSAGVGAAQ
jgi:UDP-N-acetylglucosamine 2-epimerase